MSQDNNQGGGGPTAHLSEPTAATATQPELPDAAGPVPGQLQMAPAVGRLAAGSRARGLYVEHAGAPHPVAARTTLSLSDEQIRQAVASGQGALLVFEGNDPELPIVIGLIQPLTASAWEELLEKPRSDRSAPSAGPRAPAAPAGSGGADSTPAEAIVDGRRVVIEGKEEVVLRCGKASLILRRDGKVLMRGAYVETHSGGVNRIKGAAVKIN